MSLKIARKEHVRHTTWGATVTDNRLVKDGFKGPLLYYGAKQMSYYCTRYSRLSFDIHYGY